MLPRYRPLYLIEQNRRFFSLGLGNTPRAKHIEQQMASRPKFPDEAWGGAGLRLEVAKAISAIIQEGLGWPNANFQPEDPMDKVMFDFSGDGHMMYGDEFTSIMMRMEELLKLELTQKDEEAMWRGTYGEAIDMMIAKSPDAAVCLRQNQPRPLTGSGAIEAEHCPKLAAFLDVREYLRKALLVDAKLLPKMAISRFGTCRTARELDEYVSARFRVSNCVLPHRPWQRAVMTGILLPLIIAIGGLFCFGPVAFVIAGIAMVLSFGLAIRRYPEAHRMARYQVRTLGDLVKCICLERRRMIENM
jgi:hypothetical protein